MVIYAYWKLIRIIVAFLLLTFIPAAPHSPTALTDWPQFGFDPQHSGNNSLESRISPANVASLKLMYRAALPGVADGAPVYLEAVSLSTGKDLLFVTTTNGSIAALDANNGLQVWSRQNPAGACRINNGSSVCYTTSSPAIDPNRQYVYSYGLDGRVHKYQVGDGMEITTGGWPELVSLKPFDEKGSAALSIATDKIGGSFLYVSSSGYPGDNGDYQGHLTAINLADGTQKVFNTMCSDQAVHFHETPGTPDCSGGVQSAIWARPGVVYNLENDRIYMATGNGIFNPTAHEWGDTVFSLNPDGSGSGGNPLDSYTPANYASLQGSDADLGSTAPAILPAPAASKVSHLAVQGGKDSLLRLLNLDNLSGMGATGHTGGEIGTPIGAPGGGQVLTMPAVWVNPADSQTWVFVTSGAGIAGIKLVVDGSGNPSLSQVWEHSGGGTSPAVANGVLYFVRSSLVQALDPLTGAVLWSSTGIGSIHWESPIVVNGVLYITDQAGNLTAFSINGRVPRYGNANFLPRIAR